MVLAIIGAVIVMMNWRGWTASGMKAGMTAVVQQSDLPADQKRRIIVQVDQLAEAFKNKQITFEEFGRIAEALEDHPILPIGVLEFVETNKLQASSLSAEDKAAGILAVQRLQRGLDERTLTMDDIQPVLDPISQLDDQGNTTVIDNPTNVQLQSFIEAAQQKADEAGVPNEPFEVDIAAEIESLINDTLGRQVVTTPPPAVEAEATPAALPEAPADGDPVESPEDPAPPPAEGGG